MCASVTFEGVPQESKTTVRRIHGLILKAWRYGDGWVPAGATRARPSEPATLLNMKKGIERTFA